MIKQILGEQQGLILATEKDRVFISPVKKNKIVLTAKNVTEYDMQLFVSFEPPHGVGCASKEFDFFVPAQGGSKTELNLQSSDGARIFFASTIAELTVKDRVLEWQNSYEIPFLCENVFKCAEKCDFSACEEFSVSSKGVIYLCKGEYAMIAAASDREYEVGLEIKSGACPKVTSEGKECGGVITLQKGITRICFYAPDDTSFYFKDLQSEKLVCLNTVNPKYFM